jgi:hypothetical protein
MFIWSALAGSRRVKMLPIRSADTSADTNPTAASPAWPLQIPSNTHLKHPPQTPTSNTHLKHPPPNPHTDPPPALQIPPWSIPGPLENKPRHNSWIHSVTAFTKCNTKSARVTARIWSVTAWGKEGTPLRGEVGIPYVTSHQRLWSNL